LALCPKCNAEVEDGITTCYVCGAELEDGGDDDNWIRLGYIQDKISADFAKETLKSYDIPAVVLSKSGFFGNAGLPLPSIFASKPMLFEVSVPEICAQEAIDLLNMTLGEQWYHDESE
jgi:hypothetical protein